MDNLTALKNIVRTGWISSINTADRTARIIFQDKGEPFVSAPLQLLQNDPLNTWDETVVGKMVLCLILPNGDGDGFVIGGI